MSDKLQKKMLRVGGKRQSSKKIIKRRQGVVQDQKLENDVKQKQQPEEPHMVPNGDIFNLDDLFEVEDAAMHVIDMFNRGKGNILVRDQNHMSRESSSGSSCGVGDTIGATTTTTTSHPLPVPVPKEKKKKKKPALPILAAAVAKTPKVVSDQNKKSKRIAKTEESVKRRHKAVVKKAAELTKTSPVQATATRRRTRKLATPLAEKKKRVKRTKTDTSSDK